MHEPCFDPNPGLETPMLLWRRLQCTVCFVVAITATTRIKQWRSIPALLSLIEDFHENEESETQLPPAGAVALQSLAINFAVGTMF